MVATAAGMTAAIPATGARALARLNAAGTAATRPANRLTRPRLSERPDGRAGAGRAPRRGHGRSVARAGSRCVDLGFDLGWVDVAEPGFQFGPERAPGVGAGVGGLGFQPPEGVAGPVEMLADVAAEPL